MPTPDPEAEIAVLREKIVKLEEKIAGLDDTKPDYEAKKAAIIDDINDVLFETNQMGGTETYRSGGTGRPPGGGG